jgi:hypothetical protein
VDRTPQETRVIGAILEAGCLSNKMRDCIIGSFLPVRRLRHEIGDLPRDPAMRFWQRWHPSAFSGTLSCIQSLFIRISEGITGITEHSEFPVGSARKICIQSRNQTEEK